MFTEKRHFFENLVLSNYVVYLNAARSKLINNFLTISDKKNSGRHLVKNQIFKKVTFFSKHPVRIIVSYEIDHF